jgi:long-subunit fatty acid transport protein
MPETIGLGKHSFLLDVGADRLVTDTQLKIELIDSNNNVIYTNVPKYREGTLRRVSIHVYNTATDGAATLTILGVAKDAPPEWNDTYNIKYTTTININKPLENTSPIRFYKDPISNITEIRTPYVNRYLASGSTSLISGSVEGT